MGTWQLQQAKARLSELVDSAITEGPQTITRHGTDKAVVLSIEEYKRLSATKDDFKEFLLNGPKLKNFSIPRSRDTGRTIRL